jgi:hypothetical protein
VYNYTATIGERVVILANKNNKEAMANGLEIG